MFSALPRTAPQDVSIQNVAALGLRVLAGFALISATTHRADYEHDLTDSQVRLLERVQHQQRHRNATLIQLHDSWRMLMLIDDWSFGHIYCPIQRTDPDLVLFEQLDPMRRLKDQMLLDVMNRR